MHPLTYPIVIGLIAAHLACAALALALSLRRERQRSQPSSPVHSGALRSAPYAMLGGILS